MKYEIIDLGHKFVIVDKQTKKPLCQCETASQAETVLQALNTSELVKEFIARVELKLPKP